MRVALIGFGLIGGSIARALRNHRGPSSAEQDAARSPLSVAAWSPSARGAQAALAAGVIDAAPASIEATLAGADLVILAAPPLATLELIRELGGRLRPDLPPDATVTDVASTKARIVEAADAAGLAFVGGHPMAGRELAGYGAAQPELFEGRPWVLVPGRHARELDLDRVAGLAEAVGARPLSLTGQAHDAAVAAISHLPLVLAAALVEAVAGPPGEPEAADWALASELAAGGWRDMTRLARGDPAMGAGIAVTNAGPLRARLRALAERLAWWADRLESPEADELTRHLGMVRDRLG